VPNGQKIMGEKPWTEESLTRTSWLDTPGLESGVDFLRGRWDAETKALELLLEGCSIGTGLCTLMECW